jgi:hypothetical protein
MPFSRLLVIGLVVIALAAATIAIVMLSMNFLAVSPVLGLAGLSLVALCASFAWRVFAERKLQKK